MKCSQIRKMISPYVDDELGPDDKKAFASHIADCPGCKKELEEIQSVHQFFTSTERYEAPLGFSTRVMARIEEREQAPSSFWGFFTLQPAFLRVVEVAFALVIFMIGALSGNMLVANRTSGGEPTVEQSFSLDLPGATPPDSVGGAYMRLAGVSDER
ncbi:MAG: zf-HC2 domain-containing protein [Nitrospirae bacterium]|nr:zf-HC2 domain-containing protein [Nitrospirota bacterium]